MYYTAQEKGAVPYKAALPRFKLYWSNLNQRQNSQIKFIYSFVMVLYNRIPILLFLLTILKPTIQFNITVGNASSIPNDFLEFESGGVLCVIFHPERALEAQEFFEAVLPKRNAIQILVGGEQQIIQEKRNSWPFNWLIYIPGKLKRVRYCTIYGEKA